MRKLAWGSVTGSGIVSVISLISLVISFVSLSCTVRTFALTQRPYVGVVGIQLSPINESTTTLSWHFIIKNSGVQPARVRIVKNQTVVTTEGRVTTLPTRGEPVWQTILMPGVEAAAVGHISDSDVVKVQHVLSGR